MLQIRIGGILIRTPRRIAGHSVGSVNACIQYLKVHPAGNSFVYPMVKE